MQYREFKLQQFKLQPADILVNVNRRRDPFSVIKRWALGNPYEHVFMYMGRLGIERSGRVVLQSLSNRYGEEVVVMRLKAKSDRKWVPHVLTEAIKLASAPESYYDYFCIIKYILPRLICEKLHLPMPVAWHRDPWHVCSEAVFEVFYRGRLVDILPRKIVPLPGDFVADSPLLEQVWGGSLSEEVV